MGRARGRRGVAECHGGAVQVDPGLTPRLPPPRPAWFQRLNLKYDAPLSNFAFKCNQKALRDGGAPGAVECQRPQRWGGAD